MSLTSADIEAAYRLILDRTPSQDEVAHAASQHDSVASLRHTFLGSDEFSKKYTRLREQIDARTPPALVHLHIPKTAGTTLAEAMANEPALQPNMVVHDGTLDELRTLPRARRVALRYVRGHLSMGAGDALGARFRYLCVIRRPGPRIFSFYQFIRRTRTHPAFSVLTERDMSFGDYLEYSVDSVPHRLELDNGQIRRLAGRFDHSSLGHETRLLKTALYNALAPDMIFGFVEHIDRLLQTMVDEGYLPQAEVKKANVSPNSDQYVGAIETLTDDQRRIFDSYTAWDTYFYDVSRALILPGLDTEGAAT